MRIESIITNRDKRVAEGVSVKSGYQELSKSKTKAWQKVIDTANKRASPESHATETTSKKKKSTTKKAKKSRFKNPYAKDLKTKGKPILKKTRVTIRVREHEPAEYVSRFMHEERMNGHGTFDKGDIFK